MSIELINNPKEKSIRPLSRFGHDKSIIKHRLEPEVEIEIEDLE